MSNLLSELLKFYASSLASCAESSNQPLSNMVIQDDNWVRLQVKFGWNIMGAMSGVHNNGSIHTDKVLCADVHSDVLRLGSTCF